MGWKAYKKILSVVYELFKGKEDTDYAYKNMICSVFGVRCSVFSVQCSVFGVQCSVFRNFNIFSFNDDLSTGGVFLVSITDRRKK